MPVLTLSFYKPDDGTLLGTLDETQLKSVEIRAALFQLGAGSFRVSRHLAEAESPMLQKGVICIPTSPLINEGDPFWGFVLRDDLAKLISRAEQGGEDLTLTGPGLYALLANAVLDEETWAPVPPASSQRGSSTMPGEWFWRFQPYGAIYLRSIEEGINMPGTPLALFQPTFTRADDTDEIPWAEIQLDYAVPTGTNTLELADRLAMTGGFYPVIVPQIVSDDLVLRLDAYQTIGSNLTASVRFAKAENIITELERTQQATRVTHVLIKDMDGVFHPVYETTNPYDQAVWKVVELQETNDPTTLEKIATTTLNASETQAEEFTFEHKPDIRPFTDYALGDMVTVHTGSGEHDLDESPQQVVGCRIVLDEAVRSDDIEDVGPMTERSLRYVIELGYRDTSGMSNSNPEGLGCCPKPCRPGILEVEA